MSYRSCHRNDGTGDVFCVRLNPELAINYLASIRLGGIPIPVPARVDIRRGEGDGVVQALCRDMRYLELYKRLVETINLLLYRRYDEDINAAISAIRGDDAMQRPVCGGVRC